METNIKKIILGYYWEFSKKNITIYVGKNSIKLKYPIPDKKFLFAKKDNANDYKYKTLTELDKKTFNIRLFPVYEGKTCKSYLKK